MSDVFPVSPPPPAPDFSTPPNPVIDTTSPPASPPPPALAPPPPMQTGSLGPINELRSMLDNFAARGGERYARALQIAEGEGWLSEAGGDHAARHAAFKANPDAMNALPPPDERSIAE